MFGEKVLDLAARANGGNPVATPSFVSERSVDPVILPQPYVTPGDFAAQYPTPLDRLEILAMCEEVTVLKYLPELPTGLKSELWREMSALQFTSGSTYIAFKDGECPEEYYHEGANKTVDLKNLGAKKTLSISDIMHSQASVAAGYGISSLLGPAQSGQGMPGANDIGTFARQMVADLKEKEVTTASCLVMNGWDDMLINGNATLRPLEFSGIVQLLLTGTHQLEATGTFDPGHFDRFLAEGCAKPTAIFGHPAALQEVQSNYFQLGFQGSQVIGFASGDRIIPGFNFASFVNTGIGRLPLIGDTNFPRTDLGNGRFRSTLYPLRMTHNGEPLVYMRTQIPFSLNDLTPGCTAISFEVWVKTALIIKWLCAQSVYTSIFTGNVVTTCPTIGCF